MIERKPFAQFKREIQWTQGEHVLLAAPTQCGKTTLASILAAKRSYVVVLASKTRDDNLKRRYADYDIIRDWPGSTDTSRFLLWPKRPKTLADVIATQRDVFKRCLDSVGHDGGWTVVVDEAHWASQFLKLDREIAVLHHQGSSSGVTMIVLTQRPAWIPRIIYSSASHVFIGQTAYKDDLKALSSMGGVDAKDVADTVQRLDRHDLLYLNPLGSNDPAVINIRK